MTKLEKLYRTIENRIDAARSEGGVAVTVAVSTLLEAQKLIREKLGEESEERGGAEHPLCAHLQDGE